MTYKTLIRNVVLVIAVLCGAAVLTISVLPLSRVALGTRPDVGAAAAAVERAAVLHLFAHIGIFAILSAVVWFALDIAFANAVNRMIGLCVLMLISWATEYLQHRLYDIPLEINDVLLNMFTCGAVFGLLTVWSRFRRPPPDPEPQGEHVAYILRDLE